MNKQRKRIFKYEVKMDNPDTIIPFLVPKTARLLDIQYQNSDYGKGIFSWWTVDPDDKETKKVEWFNAFTGEEIPAGFYHQRTIQSPDTGLVFHIYAIFGDED